MRNFRELFIDPAERALARYLMQLEADENAYAGYLRWKSEPLRTSFVKMVGETDNAFARLARCLGRLRVNNQLEGYGPG